MSDRPQPWRQLGFADVAASLTDLQGLAMELGVHNAADRVAQLVRIMDELARVNPDPGGAQAMADRMGGKELLWHVAEAFELAETMPWLREYPSEVLSQKLREALGGPLSPSRETSSSSRGRNITFELNLAAKLLSNGHRLLPLNNADLAAEIDNRLFVVQCKRPFSESKFHKSAVLAFKQLKRDFQQAPSPAQGIVAISVGRVLNPGNALLVGGQRRGHNAVDSELDALADRHVALQQRLHHARVLGILVHVLTPAYYPETPSPISTVQRALCLPLHPEGTPQWGTFMRVCSAIAPGGWLKYG